MKIFALGLLAFSLNSVAVAQSNDLELEFTTEEVATPEMVIDQV